MVHSNDSLVVTNSPASSLNIIFCNTCVYLMIYLGTKARVTFNGNWITYLDGILQLNMLDPEKDGLSVPVEIERIVIDVNEYHKFTKNESAGKYINIAGM